MFQVDPEFRTIHRKRESYIIFLVIMSLSLVLITYCSLTQPSYALFFGQHSSVANGNLSLPSTRPELHGIEKGDIYVVSLDRSNNSLISSDNYQSNFSGRVILSYNNTLSSSPQVAATEKGNAYVVWVDKNSTTGDTNIEFRASNDSGKTFGDKKELRGNELLSSSPQVAATEKGNAYVVWVDKNSTTGDTDIEFRASNDSGKTFGDRKELTDLMGIAPQIAVTEKGKVYAVLNDSRVQFQEILENGTIIG